MTVEFSLIDLDICSQQKYSVATVLLFFVDFKKPKKLRMPTISHDYAVVKFSMVGVDIFLNKNSKRRMPIFISQNNEVPPRFELGSQDSES